MSDVAIGQVLSQMRALASAAGPAAPTPEALAPAGGVPKTEFSTVLKNSIDQVNNLQAEAGQQVSAFERGDPDVDIARVMISLEKAGLAFEAVKQTRNRVLSAYQDIMNMPV